jgi:hypothetical protein
LTHPCPSNLHLDAPSSESAYPSTVISVQGLLVVIQAEPFLFWNLGNHLATLSGGCNRCTPRCADRVSLCIFTSLLFDVSDKGTHLTNVLLIPQSPHYSPKSLFPPQCLASQDRLPRLSPRVSLAKSHRASRQHCGTLLGFPGFLRANQRDSISGGDEPGSHFPC